MTFLTPKCAIKPGVIGKVEKSLYVYPDEDIGGHPPSNNETYSIQQRAMFTTLSNVI
jgi:hypothetical protein